MPKSLLIVEKPHSEKAIKEALASVCSDVEYDVVYIYPTSWWQWKVPKKTPLRKIPATPDTSEMVMRVNPSIEKIPLGKLLVSNGEEIVCAQNNWTLSSFRSELLGRWPEYSEIICAPHADRNGWGSLVRWLQWLLEDQPDILLGKRIPCLLIDSLEEESIRQAYQKPIPISSPIIDQLSAHFESKHLFDAWWNMNSGGVFGIAQKKAGIKSPSMITKYELMLLHILSKNDGAPFKLEDVKNGLAYWVGSGGFKQGINEGSAAVRFAQTAYTLRENNVNPDAFLFVGIGSSMSRGTILSNLKEKGWLEVDDSDFVFITELGEKLLYRCHKNTFDPDLPFRLEEWIHRNDHNAMKRYIRRYFSRQKNHVI